MVCHEMLMTVLEPTYFMENGGESLLASLSDGGKVEGYASLLERGATGLKDYTTFYTNGGHGGWFRLHVCKFNVYDCLWSGSSPVTYMRLRACVTIVLITGE
jgi:hypothetical protein